MAHYDEIQILASDCHGYFTAAAARKAGIKSFELDRWMKIGRLEKPARGVYRVANYPPSAIEPYALAVLATGERAAIYGESVLGMLNLIPTNPSWIHVATPVRTRRNVGHGIKIVTARIDAVENDDGVPRQRVADAIRATRGSVRQDRRIRAAEEGFRQGYILEPEYRKLVKELKDEAAT